MLPRRVLPFFPCGERASHAPRAAHSLFLIALLALVVLPVIAHAQDRLVFRDNHIQEGKVVGVTPDGQILITVVSPTGAAGQVGYSMALLSRVEVAAPPEYAAGMTAYQAGNWDKALASLKPLAAKYRGLPVDWMSQTAAILGDIYLEKKDIANAEAAYNDFRKLYPAGAGTSVRSAVGQARVAFAKNNIAGVRQTLTPLVAEALKSPATVSKSDGIAYGQGFYLLGQVEERAGSYQAALENYLRTTTLFYQDAAVAANAQKSADALRAAHKDLTVP